MCGSGIGAGLSWVTRTASAGAADVGLKDPRDSQAVPGCQLGAPPDHQWGVLSISGPLPGAMQPPQSTAAGF